jgi:hypothetical protein
MLDRSGGGTGGALRHHVGVRRLLVGVCRHDDLSVTPRSTRRWKPSVRESAFFVSLSAFFVRLSAFVVTKPRCGGVAIERLDDESSIYALRPRKQHENFSRETCQTAESQRIDRFATF